MQLSLEFISEEMQTQLILVRCMATLIISCFLFIFEPLLLRCAHNRQTASSLRKRFDSEAMNGNKEDNGEEKEKEGSATEWNNGAGDADRYALNVNEVFCLCVGRRYIATQSMYTFPY